MTTPTGVFVRLPLSEDQKQAMYDYVSGDVSMEEAFLAIGTPVAGDDLNPVAFMSPRDCASPSISFRPFHDYIPLVRQSDHLAALASLQAEVGRLRAGLARIEKQANEYPGDDAAALGWIVSECDALKGPEA